MLKRTVLCLMSIMLMFTRQVGSSDYIKWVDFNVPCEALKDAAEIDIESQGEVSWIDLLSMLACDNGGNFDGYNKEDVERLSESYEENLKKYSEKKLFSYYKEAYGAVLRGLLGEHTVYSMKDGVATSESAYGICAYSPIAMGYYYSDFDDFGASRSYGYKRRHLGHDMMGSVGTPVVCVEGGYVECVGWNQYGGWRIGIRSFDGKRYYYYAHLRKNHPFADVFEGQIVNAGEVIGYLGMTGYSAKENTNNINTPHLHFGLELIFDKSQKDGYCQIWINVYEITKFLSSYRSEIYFNESSKEYHAYNCKSLTESWD